MGRYDSSHFLVLHYIHQDMDMKVVPGTGKTLIASNHPLFTGAFKQQDVEVYA